MSEQQRSQAYAWLREQAGESCAEYLMSCMAPAPLSDLATKSDVDRLEGKLDRNDEKFTAFRESDRAEAAERRESDRAEAAAQRDNDRRAARHQFLWLVGMVMSLFVANMAVVLAATA